MDSVPTAGTGTASRSDTRRLVVITVLAASLLDPDPALGQGPLQGASPAQPSVLTPGGATQPEAPGTPVAELLLRSLATSPQVVTARERRRQAEAQARVAGVRPGVTLNAGAHVGRDAAGDDEDVLLMGRLELGGKRQLRIASARRAVEAARAREAQARSELTFQVRSAFASLQEAIAAEDLARDNLALARDLLRIARLRLEVGDVPETTVMRAQIEEENAVQAATAAAALSAARRIALNILSGAAPDAPLAVPAAELPPAPELDLEGLRQRALARPDVRAEEATLAARRAAVAVARTGRRPDLTVDAAHADLFGPEGNVLRVGVAFPIFDFGLTRANTELARAAAGEQAAVLELQRRTARQDVDTAYANLRAARSQAEGLRPTVDRARRLRELADLGFREGQFTLLDVLDAQRAYRETLSRYLQSVAAASAAAAALERAVGAGAGP